MEASPIHPAALSAEQSSTGGTLRAALGVLGSMGNRIGNVLLSLVTVPLLLAHFGERGYGLFVTAQSMGAWLLLADMGFPNALTNILCRLKAQRDEQGAQQIFSSAFWLLVLSSLVAAGIAILALWLAGWLVEPLRASLVMAAVVTAAASVPLSIVERGFGVVQRFAAMQGWLALGQVIAVGFGVLLIYAQFNAFAVATVFLLAPVIARLLAWKPLSQGESWARITPPVHRPNDWTTLWHQGSGIWLAQACTALIFQLDCVILEARCGAETVAVYGVALKLASCAAILTAPMFTAMWPVYADATAHGRHAWLRKTFRRHLLLAVGIALGIGVCIIVFGGWTVKWWTRDMVKADIALLVWLSVWGVLQAFLNCHSCLQNATGRTGEQGRIWLRVGLISPLLCWWSVGRWGAIGVPASLLLSHLLVAVVPMHRLTQRIFKSMPHG